MTYTVNFEPVTHFNFYTEDTLDGGSSSDTTTDTVLLNTQVIKNSDGTIVTLEANTDIANAKKRKKPVYIIGNAKNNSIKGSKFNDTLDGGVGNDTLTGGVGNDIFVYNNGDITITDYKAGEDKIKVSSDTTLVTSDIRDSDIVLTFSKGTLTLSNIIKDGNSPKITIIDDKTSLTTSQAYGAEVINITDNDGKKIDTRTNPSVVRINASKRKKSIYIIGNDEDNIIKGGNGSDTIIGGVRSNDTLTGGEGADFFSYNGGDDVITDYSPKQGDVIRLVNVTMSSMASLDNVTFSENDLIFTIDNPTTSTGSGGTLTVMNGKGKDITFVDLYGHTIGSYSGSYKNPVEKIFAKGDKDTVYTAAKSIEKVDASKLKKGIFIIGNSSANEIIGGKGNDTIKSLAGDDVLTGGAGKDLFIYKKGNDTIIDYTEGEDKIQLDSSLSLANATVNSYTDTGELVFDFGQNNTLTINNGIKVVKQKKVEKIVAQKITIIDGDGQSSTRTYTMENIKLTNKDSETFDASKPVNSSIIKINASNRNKPTYIIGNDNNNVITGSSKSDSIVAGNKSSTLNGGDGNDSIFGSIEEDYLTGGKGIDTINGNAGDDTIVGGAGADILYGGTGSDTFVYTAGDGNDVIMDYDVGDIIKLGKKTNVKKAVAKDNDFVFTIGKGKLTLKDAANKQITVIDNKGTQKSYGASANYREVETFWFDDDSEFKMQNSELNSILIDKSSLISTNFNYDDNFNAASSDELTDYTKISFKDTKTKQN